MKKLVLLVAACVALAACADSELADPGPDLAETSSSLGGVVVSPRAIAFEFGRLDSTITSVAGDRSLVFVTEPLAGRVTILDRVTGRHLGELAGPDGGFIFPFIVRVPRPGRVVVLDAGGLPGPVPAAPARVYDIDVRQRRHAIESTVVRTVSFAGLPVIFIDDVEVTSTGQYVAAESILGALWVIETDGTVRPGIFPTSGVPIPELGPCVIPDAVVDGIVFRAPGNFGPGVQSLAEKDGILYFASTCRGGVSGVPLASLSDARSPEERAADIFDLSPRVGDSEVIHGLAVDRSDPDDRWLYASDSFRLQVIRIDVHTGERQVVARDSRLFNFPSKLQFLPPLLGIAPLAVASDQEHRLALINSALSADITQPPWLVTKILVTR